MIGLALRGRGSDSGVVLLGRWPVKEEVGLGHLRLWCRRRRREVARREEVGHRRMT